MAYAHTAEIENVIERLYTVEEVADYLGVSPATVRIYLRDGRLSGIKIGSGRDAAKAHWRVTESALEAFIRSRQEPEDQPPVSGVREE